MCPLLLQPPPFTKPWRLRSPCVSVSPRVYLSRCSGVKLSVVIETFSCHNIADLFVSFSCTYITLLVDLFPLLGHGPRQARPPSAEQDSPCWCERMFPFTPLLLSISSDFVPSFIISRSKLSWDHQAWRVQDWHHAWPHPHARQHWYSFVFGVH